MRTAVLFLMVAALAQAGFIQSSECQSASGVTSYSCSLASLPAVGNAVIVVVGFTYGSNGNIAFGAVSDNQSGNTYTNLANSTGSYAAVALAGTVVMGSSGTFTVSAAASANGSAGILSIIVAEYSGVTLTIDGTAVSGDGDPFGTVTTTNAKDVILAGISADRSVTNTYWTAASGFTQRYPSSNLGVNTVGLQDQFVSATNTYSPAFGCTPPWNCDSASSVTGAGAIVALQQISGSSMIVTPTAIPANHPGNLTLTLTGAGTSWTAGTNFTVSGVDGTSKISQTVNGTTSATIVVSTGAGTGALTVSDGAINKTINVGTEILSASPASATVGSVTAVTLTGTNTMWTQEAAGTLFSLSGGLGSVFQSPPTVTSNTTATATLIAGALAGNTVITDTSTGTTATFAGVAVAAPTITSGPACTANSPSSILCVWTTSTAGSSQATCGSQSTPVLHPWDWQTGWGVTAHSIAVTGLLNNSSPTAYSCTVTTTNSGGSVTSSPVLAGTAAPLPSIQPAIASVSAPIRLNDQYNGANGLPNNGMWIDGDTQYHTWAENGDFGAYDGGFGVKGQGQSSIGILQWALSGSYPLQTFNLLQPTQLIAYNSTRLSYDYGPISIRGTMYDQILFCGGNPNLCGTLNEVKTTDHWAHSIAPSHNSGPNTLATVAGMDTSDVVTASITVAAWTAGTAILTTTLNPPPGAWIHVSGAGSCNGDYVVAAASSTQVQYPLPGSGTCTLSSASVNYMNGEFAGAAPIGYGIQPCQDYGGANGQFPCVWAANMDGWVYHYSIMGNTEGNSVVVLLTRKRVENMPLQRAADWQCYTGSQITDDGLYDTAWGPLMNAGTGTVSSSCTRLAGLPYTWIANTNVLAHMDFLPDFNRFILSIRAPVDNFYGYGGNPIFDVGPYPWGVPTLIGTINRDLRFPGGMNGFPTPILSTYNKLSSNPLIVSMTWSTSGGLFSGPDIYGSVNGAMDNYSTFFRDVTLVPAGVGVRRPQVSSNSRDGHIAGGLRLFYDFQGITGASTLVNRSPNDPAGQWSYTDSSGLFPLLFDQYGLVNFGYPVIGQNVTDGITWGAAAGTTLWDYSTATPYNEPLGAFTAIVVFGHYPYQVGGVTVNPVTSGENVLTKAGDLAIARNGSAPSWNVSVKGTVIGSVPIADGAFGAIVIRRDVSGNVTLYNSNAIESTLPLTPSATASGIAAAWSSSAVILGGSPSLYGPMSELLIWNRALSDAELVQEMGLVRGDMAVRGVTVP